MSTVILARYRNGDGLHMFRRMGQVFVCCHPDNCISYVQKAAFHKYFKVERTVRT